MNIGLVNMRFPFLADLAEHEKTIPRKILLGNFFIQRKKEAFFESGGTVPPIIAVKCQGTRCESGTVAPL
jgi:hypothetical protein